MRDALQLHVVNKIAAPETYRIEVAPVEGVQVVLPSPEISLGSLGDARVPIFLSMPRAAFHDDFEVRMTVRRAGDTKHEVQVAGTFLGPR